PNWSPALGIVLVGAEPGIAPLAGGAARVSAIIPGFLRDDYTIQVSINDYLDIYCPHYEGAVPAGRAETFTLFMVDREGYRGCYETPGAFKRWECNQPQAPFGPVRFSEKIQRFTPFSLGFEFQPGETYYYISVPSPESAGRCLKLRVSVCCRATSESAGGLGTPGAGCEAGWGGGSAHPITPSPLPVWEGWGPCAEG
uniref:Ephrin-A4 n=1 Tax=Anas platyrhynchos platyrhynchos TaxID=8840 RepID=A0A493SV69_ANAPP